MSLTRWRCFPTGDPAGASKSSLWRRIATTSWGDSFPAGRALRELGCILPSWLTRSYGCLTTGSPKNPCAVPRLGAYWSSPVPTTRSSRSADGGARVRLGVPATVVRLELVNTWRVRWNSFLCSGNQKPFEEEGGEGSFPKL